MHESRPLSTDPLLEPFHLKHLRLRNRIMSTSHACSLEEGGLATERYQAYHEEKAKGGIVLTMFGGSSNVAPDSPNVFQQLYVGDDACIAPFQRLSERVHAHGAHLMCQITHLGRRGESYAGDWLPTIAPSAIRETLHRSIPKEIDLDDIQRVIRAYADAAWRCKEGGLDGIEALAGAHLIGQFLSPVTNHRTDGYGGSLENRCRFGLEVFEAIRERVGANFVVGFRYVIDEGMKNGLDFDTCLEIAQRFEATGHIDFFNAIYGRMDTMLALAVDNMPGMASPIAPWLERAGQFKAAVRLPVFHAARIADLATARHAIKAGLLDMVAMTRAHIADPHIVNKLAAGQEPQIRPCVGATHCMSGHRPVCVHNAVTGRETQFSHQIQPTPLPIKRVVVVGGGPAGLEAARICAERGHHVTLIEATNHLGGQIRLAAQASWRTDLVGIIDWRQSELDRLGVEVVFNTYADADTIRAHHPDVVIMATGGLPDHAWLDGHALATSAWDAIARPHGPSRETPKEILIFDGSGRHVAMTAAEGLATQGEQVTVIAIDDALAPEMNYAERVIWKKRAYELGITVQFDRRLLSVEQRGNRLVGTFENEVTGTLEERTADEIIYDQGTAALDEIYNSLRHESNNGGVTDLDAFTKGLAQPAAASPGEFALYRIGDCVSSRNIAAAMYDALRLCSAL
ncbi:MAG: FAD-dependent oxidoreductase [Gammaproteobacteria bacterium]|nr:FAD-dependent oxidoreductase [Gammaproteobacteria bacterium]